MGVKWRVILFFWLSSAFVFGQSPLDSLIGPDADRVMVYLYGGEQRAGRILSDDGREIKLETEVLGTIYIRKETIEEIVPFSELEVESYEEDYRTASSFATRYYLTANALPVKKGDIYGKSHWFGTELHVGVTEQFSAGVLTTWVVSPIIASFKYSPKLGSEDFHLAVGSLVGTSGYLNAFAGGGGLHYGMMTVGDQLRNFSFQAGYFHFSWNGKETMHQTGWYEYNTIIPEEKIRGRFSQGLAFGLGGISPLGKRYSFIFESMIFFSENQWIDRRRQFYDLGIQVGEERGKNSSQLLFLMPSIRYQNGPDKAIQMGIPIIYLGRGGPLPFGIPLMAYTFAFFYKF